MASKAPTRDELEQFVENDEYFYNRRVRSNKGVRSFVTANKPELLEAYKKTLTRERKAHDGAY